MLGTTLAANPIVRCIFWPFKQIRNSYRRVLTKLPFQGWRMGMLLNCCVSAIVLCVNLSVLFVIQSRNKGFTNGLAVPWTGTAEAMSWYNRSIHVAINALSTILLSASNYTMQVLSSPTRKDIDRAHARREYLDIGFLSTRNLSRMPKRRLFLFLLMGISTIPIHLL